MTDWKGAASRELTRATTKRNQEEGEDNATTYRKYRRGIGGKYYVADVDQIEWRNAPEGHPLAGQLLPAAVLEVTILGEEFDPPGAPYMQKIVDRYNREVGMNGLALRHVAGRLGVPGYIVLFDRADPPARFWVYPYAPWQGQVWTTGWLYMDREKYTAWVQALVVPAVWQAGG